MRPGEIGLVGPLTYEEWNLLRLVLARVADLTHASAGAEGVSTIQALRAKVAQTQPPPGATVESPLCAADGTPMVPAGGDFVCPACGASNGCA